MKTLTLYTYSYETALQAFAAEAAGAGRLLVKNEGRREGLFYLCCAYAPEALENIIFLLEHITVQENPIYRYSVKLQNLAQDLRGTSVHDENKRRLFQYLKHNREINLEGYAAFRMADYRDKLDMMTYSLVKKMGRTE
jgi:hypothetical protein